MLLWIGGVVAAATSPPARALVGATLVDGTGAAPLPNAVILLRAGKIECAGNGADCEIPEGIERLNLSGFWITPGLIDAHVHFSQTGWADGRPDALDLRARYPYENTQAKLRANPERWFRTYLCSGVTSVFDVGGYPWTWDLRARAEKDTLAPRVAAAGPLLSTLDHWLNLPAERQFIYLSDKEAGMQGVGYLAAHGTSAVKVWFIVRPDSDFDDLAARVLAVGEETRERHIPLIVHATGLREAKVALRAGVHMLVHSVDDHPVDDEPLALARRHHTVYCPTLTVAGGYQRMFDALASGQPLEVDDPHGCVDQETQDHVAETSSLDQAGPDREQLAQRRARLAERERIMAVNLQRVLAEGITVAMGTDAGNPMTMHGPSVYAEMEAMESAGMSPMNVLVAATQGSAMAMGRSEDLGTIEAGKLADLLVVAGNPIEEIANMRKIRFVVRGGELRAITELGAEHP